MLSPLYDKVTKLKGKYHSSTVRNVALVLSAILQTRSVNLNKLKDELGNLLAKPHLQADSHYKRLVRFFESYAPSRLFLDLLHWALSLIKDTVTYLYIDATEWEFGSLKIHILVLSADYKGVAVPIFFTVYAHKGILSEKKRIGFVKKCLLFYELKNKILLADREFIGQQWFSFLEAHSIYFIIRIRKGNYAKAISESKSYEKLEKQARKKGYAHTKFSLQQRQYRLEMWRTDNVKEPIVYLLTNLLEAKRVGKRYRNRWKIEYCFKHLKTNGFDLEALSLKDIKKIRLLIALVIVAYVLAIRQGYLASKAKAVRMKTYANKKVYPAVSVFRTGLFWVKNAFQDLSSFIVYLANLKTKKRYLIQNVQ